IYSVGVTDSEVRIFHGYQTPVGTTYNAFLVVDDQITLIDTVKAKFSQQLLANIKEIIGDKKVDNLICNHVEPDHSGAVPDVVGAYPDIKIFGTANCFKEIAIIYPNTNFANFAVVKALDTLSIGANTFVFYPMPMVHWPDSMATYLQTEKILFSNDAFGQHIGTGVKFDTEMTLDPLYERASDYYANIVLPFGNQVKKIISQVGVLPIEIICPSHGVILTKYIPQIVGWYLDWADNKVDEAKGVIVFDTMWGTTEKMAYVLQKEYLEKGIDMEVISLSHFHYSHAMTRLLTAKYIFVGSPTLNNNMLPSVSAFLTYMKGLKPKNRVALAFGSYGWSGESPMQINDILASCGFEMLPPYKSIWNI
ncbi:MAG: FprA family A-type flavoprotein, partial [Clostridia bacterium]